MAEIFKLQRPTWSNVPELTYENGMTVLMYNESRSHYGGFAVPLAEWIEVFGDAEKVYVYGELDEAGSFRAADMVDEKGWPDW